MSGPLREVSRYSLIFQVIYTITAIGLMLLLAVSLQAGSAGVYLFVIHDVATEPDRLIFILGFVVAFLAALFAVAYTLKLPRFDFFNRIIVINIVVYSFLGLALSTLRLPLVSREVFITEFLVSTVLLVIHYVIRHRLFSPRIGVLPGAPLEIFQLHPALNAVAVGATDARSGQFEAMVANLRGTVDPEMAHLLAVLAHKRLPVYDADSFIETLWGRTPLANLTPAEMESFTPPPIYQNVKRIGELVLILACLPLLVVLSLVISVAIRIDSPDPVLFRQQRTGYQGQPFTMLKFRSMVAGSGTEPAEKRDKRVTRVGKVLRRTRLDELPQLWNVIRGEMSLIGPRPEQQQLVERFEQNIPFYGFRHTIPPGITGWAQVMHGYASSDEQTRNKLEFDFYYIKHMSAWLDLLVLIKTLRTIFMGSGAR